MPGSDQWGFTKLLQNLTSAKRELPILLANTAQTYFTRTFTNQGFDGERWQQVQRRIPDTPEWKYPKKKGLSRRTSPILVRTGALRRAVSNSIKIATWDKVVLIVDRPGAAAINEGTTGGGRGGSMPKRHFMGNSPVLMEQQQAVIKKYMYKMFDK